MSDYIVFVRHNGYAHVTTRVSTYADANRLARISGASVMYADDFNRAYKPVRLRPHHNGAYEETHAPTV